MNNERIFKEVAPPEGLSARILAHIDHLALRRARIRLALFGALFVGAGGAIVPSLRALSVESAQSGFNTYITLLASDADILVVYWKEFSFAVLESFPVAGAALFLSALFLFIFAAPKVAGAARVVFSERSLANI
jgi:hypothetical protein